MHAFALVWTALLWGASMGCDPLIDSPQKGTVQVLIRSPVNGSSLVQPGPQVEFVVDVVGCEQLRSLGLFAGAKLVATVEDLQPSQRTVVMVVDLDRLVGAPDWAYDGRAGVAQPLEFKADAECADFDQEASSAAVSVAISPWSSLRAVFEGTTRALYSVQGGAALLVEGTAEFKLWEIGQGGLGLKASDSRTVNERGKAALLSAGDETYLWKRCILCAGDSAGSLYRVPLPSLRLGLPTPLECSPVALQAWPSQGILLALNEGCAETRTASSLDAASLEPIGQSGEHGGGLVTPLAVRSDGEAVGLGHDGATPAKARILSGTGDALSWVERDDVDLDLEHTVATIQREGRWVAWVDTKQERLSWLTIGGPGQRTAADAPVHHQDISSLTLSDGLSAWGDQRLVLDRRDYVEVYEIGQTAPAWRRDFDGQVLSTAAVADDRLVVLTGDLNLVFLDSEGALVAEQGAVGSLGFASSQVVVAGGFAHYAVNRRGVTWVASYRLPSRVSP